MRRWRRDRRSSDGDSLHRRRHSRLILTRMKSAPAHQPEAAQLDSEPRPSAWGYPFVLVVAVLLTFGWLINAEFSSLDDPFNISNNPRIIEPTLASIGYYWTHAEYG